MNRKELSGVLCLLAAILMGGSIVSAAEKVNTEQSKPLPRVLLIGDSICGGYQQGVKKLLAGKSVVVKQQGNGEHTWTGLKKLDEWLGDGKWDVIHFNWGLWDVAYRNPKSKNFGHLDKVDGKLTTSPSDYEKNLRTLVARLKKTGATLVWASTTPVPDGEPGRIKGDEVKYNAVAAKIMAANGIAVDDLHAEVIRQGRPKGNNVHDTGDLSRKVADSIVAALASRGTAATPDKETPGTKKPVKMLQDDFLKLKFGMFIHFNMATYKGVQWVSGYPDPSTFNPGVDTVNTDAWADAAVSAGMKYGVLTAKHVSGFCLWDSKHTTYDVMHADCPYQKDLVAQFIKSFKSRGLKVGLYYCWRHPGFGDSKKYKVLPPECDPAPHSPDEQKKFQKAQIAELLTKYPDVFYIWNDGLDPEIMAADEILAYLRGIRPHITASANWWSWAKKGAPYVDIAVTETRHFPEGNKTPGETCWCLEQKWFWNKGFHAKDARQIVSHMIRAHSRNANFLLNVGPDRDGNIIESSIETLAEIGQLWDPNAAPGPLQ
ncbi:MAG: alpha-L-fucosidase [Planctomycetes bacterium]|nr:alpha-L-fucosidase [Planctomycetota bacterium]